MAKLNDFLKRDKEQGKQIAASNPIISRNNTGVDWQLINAARQRSFDSDCHCCPGKEIGSLFQQQIEVIQERRDAEGFEAICSDE